MVFVTEQTFRIALEIVSIVMFLIDIKKIDSQVFENPHQAFLP